MYFCREHNKNEEFLNCLFTSNNICESINAKLNYNLPKKVLLLYAYTIINKIFNKRRILNK